MRGSPQVWIGDKKGRASGVTQRFDGGRQRRRALLSAGGPEASADSVSDSGVDGAAGAQGGGGGLRLPVAAPVTVAPFEPFSGRLQVGAWRA